MILFIIFYFYFIISFHFIFFLFPFIITGFPEMALAATYGGPLFNLFLGLGLSITFWTAFVSFLFLLYFHFTIFFSYFHFLWRISLLLIVWGSQTLLPLHFVSLQWIWLSLFLLFGFSSKFKKYWNEMKIFHFIDFFLF